MCLMALSVASWPCPGSSPSLAGGLVDWPLPGPPPVVVAEPSLAFAATPWLLAHPADFPPGYLWFRLPAAPSALPIMPTGDVAVVLPPLVGPGAGANAGALYRMTRAQDLQRLA